MNIVVTTILFLLMIIVITFLNCHDIISNSNSCFTSYYFSICATISFICYISEIITNNINTTITIKAAITFTSCLTFIITFTIIIIRSRGAGLRPSGPRRDRNHS